MHHVAEIDFFEENEHLFNCHIFFATEWEGKEIESDEMRPEWFLYDDIPYSDMWIDDKEWLPLVLSGKRVKATFRFLLGMNILKDSSWEEIR